MIGAFFNDLLEPGFVVVLAAGLITMLILNPESHWTCGTGQYAEGDLFAACSWNCTRCTLGRGS